MLVDGASIDNGLLTIELTRPQRQEVVQTIAIKKAGR